MALEFVGTALFFLISLICCCCCNLDFEKSFSENVDGVFMTITKDILGAAHSGATVAADEGNESSTKDDDDVSWKLSGGKV